MSSTSLLPLPSKNRYDALSSRTYTTELAKLQVLLMLVSKKADGVMKPGLPRYHYPPTYSFELGL